MNVIKVILLMLIFDVMCPAQEQNFVYPTPPPDAFRKSVYTYNKTAADSLVFELFLPARISREKHFPVVVIFNGFGGSAMRTSQQSQAWAKAATAQGFAAVTADTFPGNVADDFDLLMAYLTAHADDLHVDSDRIAVIAWSGNGSSGLPVIQDPKRKQVKAAVFYYGAAEMKQVRLDLPVLYVRAGLDQPMTNRDVDKVIAFAIGANAPWTVFNYPGGHHGFDILDDNDASREVIEATFRFLQLAVSTSHQTALRNGLPESECGWRSSHWRF